MNIILLGPPGAEREPRRKSSSLNGAWCSCRPATCCAQSGRRVLKLGERFGELMDRGDLIPDDMIIEMIDARLDEPDCRNGAIFDGFPRTSGQAAALDEMLERKNLPLRAP